MDAWERLISGLHVTVVRRLRGVAFFVSVYTGKTSEGLRLFRWRKVELWQAFVTFFLLVHSRALRPGMLLCSCSTGSPAAPESTSSHAEESVPSHEASAPEPASADSAEPVRIGKDQVTVLVLNGCGIEGAAAEVAEKVRAAGFENVTVDNATYFNVPSTRVSYYHEENSAEAEELGDLLKVVGLASVYCYDGDDWAGGWNKDYDILVMVGDPSAADNPIYVGAGPEGESK